MSSSLSKSFHLSSSLKEEVMVAKNNQGIVSILGNDCEATKSSSSLRRTLSADMSSKSWHIQHGLGSPLKKIASSQNLQDTKINEFETNEQKPGQFDMWSLILTRKAEEDKNLPPPYVHPLVKRSSSSLSEKSLQICTESLGSETGSDGCCFSSSYPSSESSQLDSDDRVAEEEKAAQKYDVDDYDHFRAVKSNISTNKTTRRTFPPPIPSLSSSAGGSIRMNSYRKNGRLVLEAVSVPSQNNFHAQRKDGRLVLTFVNTPSEEEEYEASEEQFDMEMERFGDEETEEKAEAEEESCESYENASKLEQEAPRLRSGMLDFRKLALVANKRVVLANRNITTSWSNKCSNIVDFESEEKVALEPIKPLTQSLPPRPPVMPRMIPSSPKSAAVTATASSAAASVNRYNYYWKPDTITGIATNFVAAKDQQKRGEMAAVQMFMGCKEPRRSLLFMEPHCIATS